jgi:serine/threonine protein kinase
MAPEQHASGGVDERTDIYAAGLALYELVAGRGPFDELRGNTQALRFAHCERQPPRPSDFAPQPVPLAVEETILRALAKSPADRFQTADEMAQVLRRLRASIAPIAPIARERSSDEAPFERAESADKPDHRRARSRTQPYAWGARSTLAVLTTLVMGASSIGTALADILPRRL